MEDVKWYKSNKKINEILTFELVNAMQEYYVTEKPTDQTRLYTALNYYYLKSTNGPSVFKYFSNVEFHEFEKPARKHLSPL
jgi:hypothetical protein